MQSGAPGVPGLKVVLEFEHLPDVVGVVDGQLGRVGVERLAPAGLWRCVGAGDIGVLLSVQPSQTIAGPLSGCGFEVVQIAGLFLERQQPGTHVVQDSGGEAPALGGSDVLSQQVPAGLVHPDQPDRGEVIVPVLAIVFLDAPEVESRVGVEVPVGESFEQLALDLQAAAGQVHEPIEPRDEFALVGADVTQPGHVDRDDADRAGQGIGPEKAAPAFLEVTQVQTQATTHRSGVGR